MTVSLIEIAESAALRDAGEHANATIVRVVASSSADLLRGLLERGMRDEHAILEQQVAAALSVGDVDGSYTLFGFPLTFDREVDPAELVRAVFRYER